MKIAVLGLPDFPRGKKNLIDKRLEVIEDLIKPSQTTFISLEFLDASGIKEAEGIICQKDSKLDLIINDLEIVENWLSRAREEDSKLILHSKEILEKNLCLCEENFTDEERKILLNFNLASIKPTYFIEKGGNKSAQEIIFDSYYGFGMICFITGIKDKKLRAWAIKKGVTAFEAAGIIHSDIQRGFIKAEVIGYDDFIKAGSWNQAKQFMHLEGKEYLVQDTDILNFRFNV